MRTKEKLPGKPLFALQVISTTARSAFSFLIAAGFGPYTAAMTVVFSDTKPKTSEHKNKKTTPKFALEKQEFSRLQTTTTTLRGRHCEP
jgi:hypothetical protein